MPSRYCASALPQRAPWQYSTAIRHGASGVLAVASMTENTNTATLVFQWSSVTGRVYSIWRATNSLSAYTQHVGGIAADAPLNNYTNNAPSAEGTYFYGLRVAWPAAP